MMTSLHFNLNSASLSRENINLTIQLCHLSIHPEQSRVNKGQKGVWQTHLQGTFARFPGTKISYIIQVDATPLSVQFEHQCLNEAELGLWLEHASCSSHLQGESPTHLYCSTALFYSCLAQLS